MALEPIRIDIMVNEQAFEKQLANSEKFARDTKKRINQDLKIQLEFNIAQFQTKLAEVKNQLKVATGPQKIELQIEANKLQRGLTESKRNLNNLVNTGDQNLSRLQMKFNAIGQSLRTLIPVAVITTALSKISKGIISVTNNLEQNQIAFSTMLGSEEKAQELLKQLSAFASKTPFTISGIRDNAKQLLAMGVSTENLLPTLKMLGDISAGLSVPLERLTLAYGQVLAKGRLQGGELKQFLEAGVPIVDTLSKQLGVTSAEFYKMVGAGQVSSIEVTKALESMTQAGGKFNDLMIKQSKSIGGLWSNLQDIITQLGEKIGTTLLPQMKDLVTKTLNFVTEYGGSVANIVSDTVKTIGGILKTTGEGFGQIFGLLQRNTDEAVQNQITAGQSILMVRQSLIAGIKVVVFGISSAGKLVGQLLAGLFTSFSSFIAKSGNVVVDGLNAVSKFFGGKGGIKRFNVVETFGPDLGLGDVTKEIRQDFLDMGTDITLSFDKIKKGSSSAGMEMKAFGNIDLSKINSAIKDTEEGAKGTDNATKELNKSIKQTKDDFKDAFQDINKDIDKSKDKIEKYKDEIEDLTEKINDLTTERDKDIASRVAEIDNLLAKTGEDYVSGLERYKLEQERAEAFKNLTNEETKALEEKIKKQTEYNNLSEIGKIKADYEIQKTELETQLADKKKLLADEEQAYRNLAETKLLIEEEYTAQFQGLIDEQVKSVNKLYNKFVDLAKIKNGLDLGGGSSVNNSTVNNKNTTINANINNTATADYLINNLSK